MLSVEHRTAAARTRFVGFPDASLGKIQRIKGTDIVMLARLVRFGRLAFPSRNLPRPVPMLAFAVGLVASTTIASAQATYSADNITPEMREAFTEARPYCEEDAAKLCRWTVPGGGRLVACMLDNVEQLSPTCRQKIAEVVPGGND